MDEPKKVSQFDFVLGLPVDKQQMMYNTLIETTKQQSAEIELLKREMSKRDRALEMFATAGLDIRDIGTLEEISVVLGMTSEELTLLLNTNETEFLKRVFLQYTTLMKEKMQELSSKELDINGDAVNERLREAVTFFADRADISRFNPKDTADYPKKVDQLVSAYKYLLEWKKEHAAISNISEASAHATFHYAIKKLKQDAKKTAELAINPEERVTELAAQAPPEDKQEKIKEEVAETNKKVASLQETIANFIQKFDKATDFPTKTAEPTEEVEEEEEPEDKPKTKKK